MSSGASVTGEREVIRALDRVAAQAADLRPAHERVAALLGPAIGARSRRRSGDLAASWTPGAEPGAARIRSTLPYAGPQEFGWPARSIEPTRAIAGATDALGGEIEAIYADELRAVIRREGLAP